MVAWSEYSLKLSAFLYDIFGGGFALLFKYISAVTLFPFCLGMVFSLPLHSHFVSVLSIFQLLSKVQVR